MKKTKSPDRELSAEKAKAILDGAMREFLAHGYAATSMDKVAAAAGVSKATVYSHFQDKERLFTALIQELAQQKSVFNLQTLQGEPSIVLRRFATGMLENVMTDPQILTLIRLIIGESGRFPELAQSFVRNIEKPTIEALSQYLASHPKLRLPDPEVASRTFIGALVHYIILQEMLHGEDILPMERDRLINNLVDLITATSN
ncbi:MAG: TetR/AcrR family transcriptional regulator [Microcoleus sp. SIO2G3]|nr:TetR/AcrR family transcriptional regulator [Microcoleus sp. SIO2G3]